MNELMRMCLIVCPLIFLGGFVDSVAGGGGLITLPAYMMAGVPVHFAAGTNKVVNGIGTATATLRFSAAEKSGSWRPSAPPWGPWRAVMRGRRSPSCSPRTC